MATALYYANPRQTEFQAQITDTRQDPHGLWIALDKTCFYPEGGGQPADRGWLSEVEVRDVQKQNGEIYHLVTGRPAGESVTGRVDWRHRFDYMQQHTGQHVISAAFMHAGGYGTVSVRQGAESTTVDIDVSSLSEEVLHEVEKRAQDAAFRNLAVTDFEVTEEQLGSLELRRAPKVSGTVRIVEIDGFDRVACGGVHTATTGEVGLIKLVGTETIRESLRTVWKIGDRAREDYRLKHAVVSELVDFLSAKPPVLVERTRKLDSQLRDTQYAVSRLQKRFAAGEADRLHAAARMRNDTAIVTHAYNNEEKALFRAVAEALAESAGTLACLTNTQDDQLLWAVVASPDRALDFNVIKEELLPIIEGKGGGKPPLWQGAGQRPQAAREFLAAFEAAVRPGRPE